MKKIGIKMMLALSLGLLLSACGHDNPVMKKPEFDTLLDNIRGNRFMSNEAAEIWVCPHYFANPEKEANNKALCDKWLPLFYEKETAEFKAVAALTGKTTIEPSLQDFQDPALWQAIVKKLSAE